MARPDARVTVLSTARLRATTWLPGDYADLCALHSDPLVMRHLRSGVESAAETRARLDRFLREQVELGWTKWRLVDVEGRMVGRAGFNLTADGLHRELGYVLARRLWGLGLATEIAGALVQWHREHPDARRRPELHALAFADNAASRRVLVKIGFVAVGEVPGGGVPQVRYEVT